MIVITRVNNKILEERQAVVKIYPSSRAYMEKQFANAGWIMKTFMPAG